MPSTSKAAVLTQQAPAEERAWRRLYRQVVVGSEDLVYKLIAVVALVTLWWGGSLLLSESILPSPVVIVDTLTANAASGVLWKHLAATMQRIGAGFALAMGIGIVLGVLMGLSRKAESTLDLWVIVAMTIPSLCYVIVTFVSLGMNELSTVISIGLTAFPSIAINVWQGVKNVDNRLSDMARAFGISRGQRLVQVVMPQVMPYLIAAARFGLGIVWKVTVVAELLGRSDGVGFQLHYWFQLFNMRQVFAWTLFFTLIMLFLELVVLKQIELRAFRWRPAARL